MSSRRLALVALAVSLGCNPTTSSTPPETGGGGAGGGGGPTIGDPNAGATANAGDVSGGDMQNPAVTPGGEAPPPGVTPGSPQDTRFLGPEISHSKGVAGGVVVLFPRIIPSSIAAENQNYGQQLQQKMKQLVEKALPGRPIDVRPSPERVCPKAGCDATSINVLFTRQNNSCVAVALINAPGVSQTKLVPWGGLVELKADPIAYRDPPENYVKIKDYTPCDQLLTEMAQQDGFVEAALRAAASSAPAPTATPAAGTVTAAPK